MTRVRATPSRGPDAPPGGDARRVGVPPRVLGAVGAVAGLQLLLGVLTGLAIFYRFGAYFLDAGYYVYALASENAGTNPPVVASQWGQSLAVNHLLLSPLLICRALGAALGPALGFIAYLGLQQAVLAISGALTAATAFRFGGVPRDRLVAPAVAGAVCLPLSNVGLGSLLYPHVELFGTSVLAIAVVLLALRRHSPEARWTLPAAVLLLALGLASREDAGVHLAFTAGAAVVCSRWRTLDRGAWTLAGSLLGAGLGATLAMVAVQRLWVGATGPFSATYSGAQPWSHLSTAWKALERTMVLAGARLDLLLPVVLFVAAVVAFGRREYLAFPLAVLPWLALNAAAIDTAKNTMGIYHLFPVVLYLTAPVLALGLRPGPDLAAGAGSEARAPIHFLYTAAALSLLLGGLAAPPGGGGYLFYSTLRAGVPGPEEIRDTHRVLREVARGDGRLAVDEGVMSLEPVLLERVPMLHMVARPEAFDSVLVFPRYFLGHESVRGLLAAWDRAGARVEVDCLPGGIARLRREAPAGEGRPTPGEVFGRLQECHPLPRM